jgi:hypothetical protein
MRSMQRLLLASILAIAGCKGGDNPPAPDLSLDGPVDMAVKVMHDFAMGPQPDLAWCPGGGGSGNMTQVTAVTGQVVDEMGAPVPMPTLTVCAGLCYYGTSANDGSFSVAINSMIDVPAFALGVHGRPDRVNFYAPLPAPSGQDIRYAQPIVDPLLPTSGPMLAMDGSAQTLTSGDVTLDLAAGTQIQLDVEDVVLPNMLGFELRVYKAPDPKAPIFIDQASPPDALYGVAPFEAYLSEKAKVTVKNTIGAAAGDAVGVYVQRNLITCAPPAGALEKSAQAHVSQDGLTIVTDPGEGISAFSWIGLKKGG